MQKEFLTVKDLSIYISIKEKTIYSWVGKRLIPCYRIQGLIRFKKREIDVWLGNYQKKINELSSTMAIEHSFRV